MFAVTVDVGQSKRAIVRDLVPALGIGELIERQEDWAESCSIRQLAINSSSAPSTNIHFAVTVQIGKHHRRPIVRQIPAVGIAQLSLPLLKSAERYRMGAAGCEDHTAGSLNYLVCNQGLANRLYINHSCSG